MNWLDMRTVMFGHLVTDVLGIMVVFFLWRQNRGRYKGIDLWTAGFALQMAGTLLIMLRGAVPDWASMTLANTLVLGGMMAVIAGLNRFIGVARPRWLDAAVLAGFAAVSFYFVQFRPNLDARNVALSAASLVIFGRIILELSWLPPDLRRLMARIKHVYIFIGLVSLVRAVDILFRPAGSQDFFKSGAFDVLVLLAYQAGFILLTFDLILAVNMRLIGDLRFQEEKYSKAFRSSPYAIVLTDVVTGRIIEVNDGFVNLMGFSREEAAGKTIFDLRIWEDEESRRRALAALASEGKVFEMEFQFRKKSGEIITGLWSAEQMMINGRPSVFASINDISIRKRALEALNESVREKELLMKELNHRVKNSLAVVSSLMGLSREISADPEVKTVLTDLRTRIGSVATVYGLLDRTGQVDFVNLKTYIQDLADSLAQSYGPSDGRVRIATQLADLNLKTRRALPLGLIINELIINGFKYAYPDGKAGEIRVELKSVTNGICFTVSDDGVGRTAGVVSAEGGGSGFSLVETLADQIGARISYPPGPGTTVVIIL